MSGSDEEGDYTLDIHSVTLEDDALFQCQVTQQTQVQAFSDQNLNLNYLSIIQTKK